MRNAIIALYCETIPFLCQLKYRQVAQNVSGKECSLSLNTVQLLHFNQTTQPIVLFSALIYLYWSYFQLSNKIYIYACYIFYRFPLQFSQFLASSALSLSLNKLSVISTNLILHGIILRELCRYNQTENLTMY